MLSSRLAGAFLVSTFALALGTAVPVETAHAQVADEASQPWSPIQRDFPYQSACVSAPWPKGNTAYKAIAIRLGPAAAATFDTDLLRHSAGWTGAFLTPTGVAHNSEHGGHPHVAGDMQVGTQIALGWADASGSFADPRKGEPYGPIPEAIGRWNGLYTVGDAVVLSYTMLGATITEQPSAVVKDGRTGFVRTFRLERVSRPMSLLVADVPNPAPPAAPGSPRQTPNLTGSVLVRSTDDTVTAAAVVGAPADAKLEVLDGGRIVLRLPKNVSAQPFKVVVWRGLGSDLNAFPPLVAGEPTMVDVRKGGPAHWPNPILTKGVLGPEKGAYTVDRITTPFPGVYGSIKEAPKDWKDNVFRRRIMIGGFDFFPDGKRAALATWEGDVWIVSGIDDKLDKLTWRRFASGLYETLGLKIVDGVIHTSGRDQITRLHDLNGDGEADYYENFNNQVLSTTGFHEFQFDLQTDAQGNFYTSKAGPVRAGGRGFGGGGGNGEVTSWSGTLQRISKDGKRREVVARGFRAPNGIGVGPRGELTTGDNEGSWMPACPLNWVRPGGFYGVEDLVQGKAPDRDPPLCWLPMSYDNSGGGQVWVTSKKWGPLGGELLHLSYGKSAVYRVLKQPVRSPSGKGEIMQGGVVRVVGGADAAQYTGVPQQLTASAMRGRFNPIDGQLYVAGLRGWQTNAANNTGFDRIRYTGKPLHTVTGLAVDAAGVHLTFSHPLDPSSADVRNVSGDRWNYRRTKNYGSPDYRVSKPDEEGRDKLDIVGVGLSQDRRTLTIAVDDLRPVNQMVLRFKVKAEDGTPIAQSIAHTIHVVPPAKPGTKLLAKAQGPRTPDAVRAPSLVVTYAGPGGASDVTTAAGVRLFVPAGKGATAMLPPGPFTATFDGVLSVDIARAYRFQAELAGALSLEVNGRKVLETTGTGGLGAASEPVALNQGENHIRATFTPSAKGDAFVRLGWIEPTFGFEPLPESALAHKPSQELANAELAHRGRALFLERRCVRCHSLGQTGADAPVELAMDAPAFTGIGDRLEYTWMKRWIENPRNYRKSTRMPQVLRNPYEDSTALAAYLYSLKGSTAKVAGKAGGPTLTAAAHTMADGHGGDVEPTPLFEKLRCTGCHAAPGWEAPEETRVSLATLKDKYGDEHRLAAFLRSPDALFAWTRMPNFRLSDAEADELAKWLLERGRSGTSEAPARDPKLIARGQELVETRGCLSCHALAGAKNRYTAPDAETVRTRALAKGEGKPAGCLDGAAGGAPDFNLSRDDRAALAAFLKKGFASLERHDPVDFAQRLSQDLGCGGCHGPIAGLPTVESVGGKLKPEWTAAFLAGRVPYKPRAERNAAGGVWMEARMPAFPRYATALAEGLAAMHGYAAKTPAEPPVDRALAKIGSKLVSSNGGLACVTCHGAGTSPATQVFEVEGINLAHSGERLLRPFFDRWMRNPTRVDPGTKMPAFFDEQGKSALEDVLGGDAKKQIDAIWHYIRLGNKMPKPGEG